jgi:hypothetical protein
VGGWSQGRQRSTAGRSGAAIFPIWTGVKHLHARVQLYLHVADHLFSQASQSLHRGRIDLHQGFTYDCPRLLGGVNMLLTTAVNLVGSCVDSHAAFSILYVHMTMELASIEYQWLRATTDNLRKGRELLPCARRVTIGMRDSVVCFKPALAARLQLTSDQICRSWAETAYDRLSFRGLGLL